MHRIPRTGTEVSGSEDVYRVRYRIGFCEFGMTRMGTVQILALIFKSLIPDWPMIIDAKAIRDVFNVIELSAMTQLQREQDLSRDTTELKPPKMRLEERGRWIFVKKEENLISDSLSISAA
jgi:hypothetical protein